MNDEHLVTLYLDGELDQEEATEFETRLDQEPELMALLEEQLALSVMLERAGQHELDQLNLEGFTARVMAALPEEVPQRAPERSSSTVAVEEHQGLLAWLSSQLTPLLIGAAVAAAILISLRVADAPNAQQTNATSSGRSTVLINLDEPKSEGAAPVIWVLDEEEGGSEGGDDDPI